MHLWSKLLLQLLASLPASAVGIPENTDTHTELLPYIRLSVRLSGSVPAVAFAGSPPLPLPFQCAADACSHLHPCGYSHTSDKSGWNSAESLPAKCLLQWHAPFRLESGTHRSWKPERSANPLPVFPLPATAAAVPVSWCAGIHRPDWHPALLPTHTTFPFFRSVRFHIALHRHHPDVPARTSLFSHQSA